MAQSTSQANRDLNYWFGLGLITPPANPTATYLAIGTNTDNSETDLRAGIFVEPSGSGYLRPEVTVWEQAQTGGTGSAGSPLPLADNDGRRVRPRTVVPASGGGAGIVDFINTGGAAWETIQWVFVLDQADRLIDYLQLTQPRYVNSLDTLRFQVGSLQFGRKWD